MAKRKRVEREDHKKIRLWGAPQPEKFKDTIEGQALAESARIHFAKKQEQDRLLATEMLALHIFRDPLAARAFAINPKEYLRRAGFNKVDLDLNSPEVHAVMALGDPDVRDAAYRQDVKGFVNAMIAQGIRPEDPTFPVIPVEVAAWISAVVAEWVAVSHWVAVYVGAAYKVAIVVRGPPRVLEPKLIDERNNRIAQLARLVGDRTFAKKVQSESMRRIIEEYVKLHTKSTRLQTSRQGSSKTASKKRRAP